MYVRVCVHCNDFLSAPRDLGSCTFGLIAHRGKELNSITPWRVLKNIYEFLHDWCLSIFLRFFFFNFFLRFAYLATPLSDFDFVCILNAIRF